MFEKARATGLRVTDWQNVITVNMLGQRFYDETGRQFIANNYKGVDPYIHGHYSNAQNIRWSPNNWLNAAHGRHRRRPERRRADLGDLRPGRGRAREVGSEPAECRFRGRLLLQADTVAELAKKIVMKYQRVPMPPGNLEGTVGRYNTFVDTGRDYDFDKPRPLHMIDKPPFYAALVHARCCTTPAPDCASMRAARSST